ncbi:MAG: TRAP transporter large permease subunit [Deltaproteobacteria bacterium]|nr:TRAP transporter large permease subunit [Deltaproteobacteria bacterium]
MDPYQLAMVGETVFEGVNDFGLLSIPLFIFMGMIAAVTRAGSDLYECFHRWLYRFPGGLGVSNIASCAIFAALTGSSPACAAAIGTMGIPGDEQARLRRTASPRASSRPAGLWAF